MFIYAMGLAIYLIGNEATYGASISYCVFGR